MKSPQSFPKERPVSFPFKAGRGHFLVTLYRFTDGEYEAFKLPFLEGGVRRFHRFPSYELARDKGNEMIDQLATGNASAITLKDDDKLIYSRSVAALRPLNMKLDAAVSELVQARSILEGTGVSLIEAAREFAKRHKNTIPNTAVADAVVEFIAAKRAANKSECYISDLEHRLNKFKDCFNCNLSGVSEIMLRGFLDGLKLGARSHNNFLSTLVTFFRWCVKKKYLPSDWNEFASIEAIEEGAGEIEIFTPEEMADLLAHADPKLVPFLAIGAFAGLRSSEICRLDWKQIGVGNGKYIEVKARDARKTKQRRLVPISDNLRAWLQSCQKSQGKIWPYIHQYLYELMENVTEASKIAWKQNALRHSYISYRMAEAQDAAKVSLEAGNSPQMIFSNYRELVTPEEAARWFSIKPDETAEGKITWLKAAA